MSSTSLRGFASMDLEKRRAIAKMGGIAAHKQGVAHEWNEEEARAAGRKGGGSLPGTRTGARKRKPTPTPEASA